MGGLRDVDFLVLRSAHGSWKRVISRFRMPRLPAVSHGRRFSQSFLTYLCPTSLDERCGIKPVCSFGAVGASCDMRVLWKLLSKSDH